MKALSAKKVIAALALLLAAVVVVWALLPKGGNSEYAFTARVLSVSESTFTVEVLEQDPGFLVKRLPKQFTFEKIADDLPDLAPGDVIRGMVMPSTIQEGTARVMTYEIITN